MKHIRLRTGLTNWSGHPFITSLSGIRTQQTDDGHESQDLQEYSTYIDRGTSACYRTFDNREDHIGVLDKGSNPNSFVLENRYSGCDVKWKRSIFGKLHKPY
jgi:hypothetical protein